MLDETVDTLLVIFVIAVVSPIVADLFRRIHLTDLVVEILLGVVVGPQVLGVAHLTLPITTLSSIGLSVLMFLAGYELDFAKVRGAPVRLASIGWLISLAIGLSAGALAQLGGRAVSWIVIGLALTTTALATLMPMWRDSDLLSPHFATHGLAVGTVGEFGPIVAVSVFLSSDSPIGTSLLLVVFVFVAAGAALVATRQKSTWLVRALKRHTDSSSQLPVRATTLVLVFLLWLSYKFGLDVLLGAFAAGIVVRLGTGGIDTDTLEVKIDAIGYGLLIPVFFVVSGMQLDVEGLVHDPFDLLRLPIFLAAFLVARGVPVFLLYRKTLTRQEQWPFALFSATALPLVVVISEIAVHQGQLSPASAATLVGAAVLSVILYPALAFHLLSRAHRSAGGVRPAPEPPV
jgi:flagellin-like protein